MQSSLHSQTRREHHRHPRWQHLVVMVCCLAVAAGILWVHPVSAFQEAPLLETYPGGYTLIPIEPGPIILLSMTVDISIREEKDQVLAEVQAAYRVHNTDQAGPRTLTVAFPGYPSTDAAPEQVSLLVGNRELEFSAAQTQWWVADVRVAADERATLVLTYSAPLSEPSGAETFIRFRYPSELTGQAWPKTLESARISLSFNEPPNPQSWLQLTPENYKLTAEAITWSFDVTDPPAAIDYYFMRPSLWAQLRSARLAAADQPASAEAQLALGNVYAKIATTAQDAALFNRYLPLATAATLQAQALEPAAAAPYLALARLYRARAELVDPPDSAYVSLAVEQLAAALTHGSQDPAVAEAVAQDFATLIARARAQGDFDTAYSYLQRLDDLAKTSPLPLESAGLAAEKRLLAVEWATTILRDQGPAPARKVIIENFGSAAAEPPDARLTRLSALHIETATQPGKRSIRVMAGPREVDSPLTEEGSGSPLTDELYHALAATTAASVTLESAQPFALRLDLPFASAEELRSRQQALAAVIPAAPEWITLQALLQTQSLNWERQEREWRTTITYSEEVGLEETQAVLEAEASALVQAAATLDLAYASSADPFDALLAELWRAEAAAWQRFAANQRGRFTLTLFPRPGAPVVRSWTLEPGERLVMRGSVVQYRVLPFVLGAGALYLLFVVGTWRAWRRKGHA